MVDRVPVTVLTGFLGSGKTTLLNRILTEEHGRRVAVIQNEFGDVPAEQELVIATDEEIFEVNNGCICCNVRGDLIRTLSRLMKRRDRFDHVVIETTGLADPGPVLQTFFFDDELRERLELDAVVTLVDAHHVEQHLERTHECAEQIAFADVIVLNKADLVSGDALDGVEHRVAAINPRAKRLRAERAEVSLDEVLGVHAFDLERTLDVDPTLLDANGHHDHEHTPIAAHAVRAEAPVLPEAFDAWLQSFLQERGQDVFRFKGILDVAGDERRYVLQGVHMMVETRPDRPWTDADERSSRFVFIGRDLDASQIESALRACAA